LVASRRMDLSLGNNLQFKKSCSWHQFWNAEVRWGKESEKCAIPISPQKVQGGKEHKTWCTRQGKCMNCWLPRQNRCEERIAVNPFGILGSLCTVLAEHAKCFAQRAGAITSDSRHKHKWELQVRCSGPGTSVTIDEAQIHKGQMHFLLKKMMPQVIHVVHWHLVAQVHAHHDPMSIWWRIFAPDLWSIQQHDFLNQWFLLPFLAMSGSCQLQILQLTPCHDNHPNQSQKTIKGGIHPNKKKGLQREAAQKHTPECSIQSVIWKRKKCLIWKVDGMEQW